MIYMKQLDSLRGLAVMMVLYTHFYAGKTEPAPFFQNTIEWGGIGVGLFFVLSGFLISGILLKNRADIENGSKSRASCLKSFYIRRTLRIFPIYYMSIFLLYMINLHPVRETIWWLVTYTSNIYFSDIGRYIGSIGHLWSLSIEEQFYLLWPWVIIFTPRKYLLPVILCFIASSPLYMHFCGLAKVNSFSAKILAFNHLDKFGFGALLAYQRFYGLENTVTDRVFNSALYISGALFIESLILYGLKLPNSFGVFYQTFSAIFYACVIKKFSTGFSGLFGRILESKPFVYIGKISYGIYLYHVFIMYTVPICLQKYFGVVLHSLELQAILYTLITLCVASISWYLIERPLLTLKDRVAVPKSEKSEVLGVA